MKISVKYAVTGALSGAANGFFGAGGGLFLVPLLISWCGMEQKRAFATSVAVIFPLCAVSAVQQVPGIDCNLPDITVWKGWEHKLFCNPVCVDCKKYKIFLSGLFIKS